MEDRPLRLSANVLIRTWFSWLAILAILTAACIFPDFARAQSPELSMREFASGQIKKGVRSIGFGGDGATWGNYSLVWRDNDTGVADYGHTGYTNGNNLQFSAAGLTSPSLSHHLTIYGIVMYEEGDNVRFSAKSQGLGPNAIALIGKGSDQAVFSKIAIPLGKEFSVGILLAHETSYFDVKVESNLQQTVHYSTSWRPSAGLGATWQPSRSMLFRFRSLLNSDLEHRTDPAGTAEGTARTTEFRLGSSIAPWSGALIDTGVTRLERRNDLAATHSVAYHPNLGFEQTLLDKRLALRGGLDETSPTAGLSLKFSRYKLDTAYVSNMARGRVGNLFGTGSRSIVMTFTLDYGSKQHRQGEPAPK